MVFSETTLKGVYIIEPKKIEDQRGFFARIWCKEEFKKIGLNTDLVQCNISFNKKKGTLRGLHYQACPYKEIKLVRCTRGSIYDVVVDITPESATFKHWFCIELNEENRRMLYIPKGFAHGFQTLQDDTEVFYQMSEYYNANSERGLRWDSSQIGVKWPEENFRIISDKDRKWPDLF